MIGQAQQTPPKAPAGADGGEQRWRVTGLCLVLAAITFAVFGQTLWHEFTNYDDNLYVYENPKIADGLGLNGLAWVFTHADCNLYHPLTMLSLRADYQLYGLHAGGYHLTNVLIHTASVILLFLILRQMTGALWRSAFVAAVFAIHPLRVESVAWVAERKDVLSGLFFILTIGAYVRYAENLKFQISNFKFQISNFKFQISNFKFQISNFKFQISNFKFYYGLVILLFALGLMSKPMAVTLPLVLLLLDYWPLQRMEPKKLSGLILEKLPLLALAIVAGVVNVLAAGKAVTPLGYLSMTSRLSNAMVSYTVYLRQMVWPQGLAVLYPFPLKGVPAWEVALAIMLLIGISVAAWGMRRARPWLLMGWLWYLVMLLPVAGIIQVGRHEHADRYTYLPLIGVYVALTWLVAEWRLSRVALGGIMTGTIAVLMVFAWKQTAYWQNSETLWTHTLDCTPNNAVAHNNLGTVLLEKGDLDETISHCRQALQIRPDYPDAHYNLGRAIFRKGQVDEAIAQYQQALQINPDFAPAHFSLATALRQKGRLDEAIAEYQAALQINPSLGQAHNDLGTALRRKGRVDEAIAHYQKALELMPGNESVHVNLANAFLQKGQVDRAMAHYQNALQIDPADMEVQNNLAWLLATSAQASLRNGDKAVQLARRANEQSAGTNPVVLGTLAAALAEAGQFGEAARNAQKAIATAQAARQPAMVRQLNGQLQLYQAGRAFHQP